MVRQLLIRSNNFILVVIFCLVINISKAQQYPGTNLRGQIQYFNPYQNSYYSLPNAVVDIYHYDIVLNKYDLLGTTITNGQGFYFLYSIQPQLLGSFYIQVNKSKNYQIVVGVINYFNNQYNYNQFWDIPILYY